MTSPPGSSREQLPAEILALLPEGDYVSSSCRTGQLIESDVCGRVRYWGMKLPDTVTLADLEGWIGHLHARCRLNHKFTGKLCVCRCHEAQSTGVLAEKTADRATVERVLALRAKWLSAGAPPLGVSITRWWDKRLIELDTALAQPKGPTS